MRRTNKEEETELLEYGGIVVDKTAHSVTIDGKPVDLSFKEFELLTYFMENKGIALSREKILNHVWNYDYFGDARTIDTHVKKLQVFSIDPSIYRLSQVISIMPRPEYSLLLPMLLQLPYRPLSAVPALSLSPPSLALSAPAPRRRTGSE